MADIAALADQLVQIAAELARQPPQGGWIDQFRRGEILAVSQAAKVASVTNETIRRWCEQSADTERPIGHLVADSLWLVDLGELLHFIEAYRGGLPARLAAQTNWEKQVKTWSATQRLN